MEIRILEMAQVDYPAHTFPWHVHPDHHTLSLVTGGMALLEFPKASIQTQPGHLIYIPAGFAHRTVVLLLSRIRLSDFNCQRIIPHQLRTTVLQGQRIRPAYFKDGFLSSKKRRQRLVMYRHWYGTTLP